MFPLFIYFCTFSEPSFLRSIFACIDRQKFLSVKVKPTKIRRPLCKSMRLCTHAHVCVCLSVGRLRKVRNWIYLLICCSCCLSFQYNWKSIRWKSINAHVNIHSLKHAHIINGNAQTQTKRNCLGFPAQLKFHTFCLDGFVETTSLIQLRQICHWLIGVNK